MEVVTAGFDMREAIGRAIFSYTTMAPTSRLCRAHGRRRLTALCALLTSVTLGISQAGAQPVPAVPFSPLEVERLKIIAELRSDGASECDTAEDCDDGIPCTANICAKGTCIYDPITDCVECSITPYCSPIDIVFLMDTSGSMRDEATALCSGIEDVVTELSSLGVDLNPHVLGITETPEVGFNCLTTDVVSLLGDVVPGDSTACPFPDGSAPYESWGPATAIVAKNFRGRWRPGATRIIVPISDEGPCNGSLPEGCSDPGEDRDSIDNAVAVALDNEVVVSPIVGSGSDACVINLALALAAGTGGQLVQPGGSGLDPYEAIMQILLVHCTVEDACDDLQACTENDTCVAGVCSGAPIPDCLGCADVGECDDGDACTFDECLEGRCEWALDFDDLVDCCDPVGGLLTPIDDGDPCTNDICDPATGQVTHPTAEVGTACDDGYSCTALDACDMFGECIGTAVDNLSCSADSDCYGQLCDVGRGRCFCAEFPELCITPVPAGLPEGTCRSLGDELVIDLELGESESAITGGQFLLQYDPQILDFIDIAPGANVDPGSPFVVELVRSVSESEGTIFCAVSIEAGAAGTRGPAIMATARFAPIAECSEGEICFLEDTQRATFLMDDRGQRVPHVPCCTGSLVFAGTPPVLSCPESAASNTDPGQHEVIVSWSGPGLEGGCGGLLEPACTATSSTGEDVSSFIGGGGEFAVGHYEFECSATDSCGATVSCQWTVDVQNANTVSVDIELSPTIHEAPLSRCIVFELYSDCFSPPIVIEQTVEFGGPFDFPGQVDSVTFKVPGGNYGCLTARDPLHTLRSTAFFEILDGKYVATFEGDPAFGGNWLIGGNLNGDRVIDIVDHALLLTQYLTTIEADTVCGDTDLNADINGDGIVNLDDLGIIQRHFLMHDKDACCPAP